MGIIRNIQRRCVDQERTLNEAKGNTIYVRSFVGIPRCAKRVASMRFLCRAVYREYVNEASDILTRTKCEILMVLGWGCRNLF